MSSDEAPNANLLSSTKKGVQIRADSYVRYNPLYLVMHGNNDDTMSDYLSLLNMLFSMVGMMMKMKWCAWAAVFVSTVNFTNSRANEENRQILSSFMLSITAVIMSYMQNPQPMTLPFL